MIDGRGCGRGRMALALQWHQTRREGEGRVFNERCTCDTEPARTAQKKAEAEKREDFKSVKDNTGRERKGGGSLSVYFLVYSSFSLSHLLLFYYL